MTIGFIGIGMTELLMIAAAVLLLAAFIASIAWVWRDAERRGQPGFIVAVLVAFLFWPFSLIVWLLARPQVGATPTAGRPLSSHEGIITLSPQVGATPTAGRQRGVCGVCGVVLLVVLLGIGLIIGGAIMIVKIRNDNGSTCLDQVSVIATAYLRYQADNGRPPEYLHELGLRKLRCPSGTGQGINIDVNAKKPREFGKDGTVGEGIPYQRTTPGGGIHVTQSGPSDPYELLPGTEPTDIIVREVWINHGGKGGAIAFGDGSVAWVDSPYKPIRMDVFRAAVERQLREKLGEEFTKLGTVTFNAEQNRYDVAVELQIDGKEIRSLVDFSQIGAKEAERRDQDQKQLQEFLTRSARHAVRSVEIQDLSIYAGSLKLTRRDGTYFYAFKVDELMEREDWAEKN